MGRALGAGKKRRCCGHTRAREPLGPIPLHINWGKCDDPSSGTDSGRKAGARVCQGRIGRPFKKLRPNECRRESYGER